MATQLIDEEKMMIDVVRDLAREKVAPRAAEIDAKGEFPWDMKELLAEQDILGMPFPEEYGGLGSSELSILMVIEELAQSLRHDLAASSACSSLARCRSSWRARTSRSSA